MPKALSLKKVQQPAPSKNQKSITHFFKNVNVENTQKQCQSQFESATDIQPDTTKKSGKRKATSATNESIEINDEGDFQEQYQQQGSRYHTPKKFKPNSKLHKSPVHSSKKISPEKENFEPKKISPLKLEHTDEKLDVIEKSDEVTDRLPLTPVKVIVNGENNSEHVTNSKIKLSKSNIKDFKDHEICIENIDSTPRKVLPLESCNGSYINGLSKERTPRKSPGLSRVEALKTPQKLSIEELSPSKSGSTVKTVECSLDVDDFGDQWGVDEISEDYEENLDLTIMQRCEVLTVSRHPTSLELRLKNSENHRGTCFVDGVWLDTSLSPGEIISVVAEKNSSGQYYVGNTAGLIALRPDHLLSCTSIVAGVFCQRKAILQERFKGLDSGNTAMTIGILVHELVQKALTQNIMEVPRLQAETDKLINKSIQMLYEAGMYEEETRTNMQPYISPLTDFMQTYVAKPPLCKKPQKDQWNGHIDKVLDIEENLCCPQLGLKGKIDATVQVTVHGQNGKESMEMALELKSGMARGSAEHRGQLALYGLALGLRRHRPPPPGLLLYLKERVVMREVRCGHPERRDLTLLRNQLAAHLARGPAADTELVTDIEEAEAVLRQSLPAPIRRHNVCAACPYLTLCSLHLWHGEADSVEEDHPLRALRAQAVGHVSEAHAQYFRRWATLLRAEELTAAPLSALWTLAPSAREKRGTCAANLTLKTVKTFEDRYLHTFNRRVKEIDSLKSSSRLNNGPSEGEFSIVSTDAQPWISAGVVTTANEKQLTISLDRDLSRRLSKDSLFHIDTYESYATVVQNLTNLGVLMDDSDNSSRLRRLIIDLEPPEFDQKLPREVGRLGSKLMRGLNIEQQRAVLKALAAKDYALLRGLPGTGKTQTISVLIQMLVGLKQRVLVTAHTHSAVDTVLGRLPAGLKIMRLGSAARVAPHLADRCEQTYIEKCKSVKELEALYESMEVVGVTCLGAAHAMLKRTQFDVCIVDEATQVVQSTVLRPLFAARRFVLVGDPDQLPPVVRSKAARRLGMEESLFHRLMREDSTQTLRLQYRMNRALADLANAVAYDGKLKCADERVAEATLAIDHKSLLKQPLWMQEVCSTKLDRSAVFLDLPSLEISDNNKSCTNVSEACFVMAIVEAMLQCDLQASDIGVIAPYREQVSLLRRGLQTFGVECSTVDQFQGRDKPLVVYSATRAGPVAKVKEGEILNDQRRLAVSVTRAKHKLITIGNTHTLRNYQPLQRLIEASSPVALDHDVVQSVVNKYKNKFL